MCVLSVCALRCWGFDVQGSTSKDKVMNGEKVLKGICFVKLGEYIDPILLAMPPPIKRRCTERYTLEIWEECPPMTRLTEGGAVWDENLGTVSVLCVLLSLEDRLKRKYVLRQHFRKMDRS